MTTEPWAPEDILKDVDPAWDRPKLEHVLTKMHRKQRRRTAIRAGVTTFVLVAAALSVFFLFRNESSPDLQPSDRQSPGFAALPQSETGVVRTADGSRIRSLSPDARFSVSEVTEESVRIVLDEGGAHFDVVPNQLRTFQVEAGPVMVEVLGTAFRVEHRESQVYVAVERGRVRVSWADREALLADGEARLFPPRGAQNEAVASAEEDQDEEEETQTSIESREQQRTTGPPVRDWRVHAEAGEYAEAFEALSQARAPVVRDNVRELLLAADAARYSGHPAEALTYLEQISTRHSSDPRASLAAFTAGRILLYRLRRPREAAVAFARVGQMSPSGSLAESALAREVEAWSRAGQSGRARQRAEEYLRRYPQGQRAQAVRRYGGLESD